MANKIYPATSLTGGGDGALDSIDGLNLQDGDKAIVFGTTYFRCYNLDDDSGATESSPNVISPDTNAGTKRWILLTMVYTTNTLSDTDADTLVQVEESADEDTIRFDIAGSEVAAINASGISGTLIKDEDTMSSNSATHLITQQSAKAYMDSVGSGGVVQDEITDADSDTKIQVEESADEDVIRFDVAGAEVATIDADGITADEVDATELKIGGSKIDATPDEIDYGCDGMGVTIPRMKIIEIGDWDMDAYETKTVAHGLTFSKIVGVRVAIINDSENTTYPLDYNSAGTLCNGYFYVDATNINLGRPTSSVFNSTSYNAVAPTIDTRGWVILDYIT